MKWQIVLEAEVRGNPAFIEARADEWMEFLVDSGVEDPTVGTTLSSGFLEIEFVVEASSYAEARSHVGEIVRKVWRQQGGAELVGESTRRVLQPA